MASPARTRATTTMRVISKMICTMKRLIKSFTVIAVAAMGLTACQDVFVEPTLKHEEVFINFIAEAEDTRTSVDTTGETPKFSWSANETFVVLEQTDALAEANSVIYEKVDEKASITAAFTANAGHSEYQYATVYPAAGYVKAASIEEATLSLPATQTMVGESYDPTADLMVSRVVTTVAQPTEAQQVQFTRLAAVVKMTLKGLALEAGDSVEKVIFTAEGKALAGSVTADLNTPHDFTVAEGVDNISVTTTSADDIYFTVLPTTLEAGDAYTITVITNKRLYVKQGEIPAEKSLIFEAGMVNRFSVDMSTVVASEKWVLVRDVNNLEAGDIVTFVTKDNNWVMGKWGSYYPYASYTEVIKFGDYFYHPIAEASEANNRVQQLIVVPRSGKENAFDFYNQEAEYTGDTYAGYICTYSTNNYLKVQATPSNKSLFYTTIAADGTATLEATDSEDKYKTLKYRLYNNVESTSNRRFGCTQTITDEHGDICIYKIEGAKGVVPVEDAVITVPDEEDNEYVVVAKEGATTDTIISEVEFTYVGDWAIEVTTDAEWLTLNYADGSLRYTAEANEGEVRYATVTITASMEGKESLKWTFKVVQKGAPVKVSIAEFIKKEIDANVEYEVTGIITKKGSGNSYDTTLSDGSNNANFRYVDMSDGTSFYNNEDIQVGDVVTIVASKSYSTSYGGSSSAHSTCMGYYNLEAEVENDLVAYSGGSVEITLNKVGTLSPVGDITAKSDKDFAKVTYTTNADKATVTLSANTGAPRQVVVTFTDGYAVVSVTIVQSADTALGNTWELVTDASTLKAGDQLIIAAKDYDVAMSTTISSERRSAVDVTKLSNYYLTPASNAQVLVLANGTVDGTYAFYDADNKGFLVSSSTSAELVNQAYINDNASFGITIADDVATISNKAGDFSNNKLAYYFSSSSNKYFCSSNSTTSYYKPICLYRLVGVEGTIPVVPADITANDAVISDEAAAGISIPEVVFNYVGDWTISATVEADWVDFAFDKANNCLTYTAEANSGVARTTNVTITASLDGESDITWTFELLQKGYTPSITIAEYNAIPAADRNDSAYMRYKLTGRIESIESTSSTACKFTITDETASVQVYGLETEDGSKDFGDFDLKVGDVVTLTSPRFTEVDTAGKGSNSPAHYISHYNISATATAAEYTAGSTATISLTSTSGMDVTYEMEACDYAELSYTSNYSQENTYATVTFTSENTAEVARSVNVTFKTGLASTTITVMQKVDPAKVKGWVLVTDASELAVGDEVIFVAKNYNVAMGCFTSSSSSTANKNKSTVEIIGNSITSEEVENKSVQKYTIVEGYVDNSVAFEFTYNSSTYYLYANSGLKPYSNKDAGSRAWTIDVEANGNATITSQGSTKYVIRYNYKSDAAGFSTYATTAAMATDADADVCIYKNSEK